MTKKTFEEWSKFWNAYYGKGIEVTQHRQYKRFYTCEDCGKQFFTGGPNPEKEYKKYLNHTSNCMRSHAERRRYGLKYNAK